MAKKIKRRVKKKPAELPGEIVGEINGFPIRRVQVGALTGAEYNPREISDEAFQGLQNSVDEFGLPQAIVWNRKTQRIVGGHQRLKTLDPDETTDVVEVDLDLDREKALNLTLNSDHISGDFTTGLSNMLAELEVKIPDLSVGLRLAEMYVDIPVEVDDILSDMGGDDDGDTEKPAKSGSDKGTDWDASDLRQIILILSSADHEEAISALDQVTTSEDCETHTEAVLWLLRNYVG